MVAAPSQKKAIPAKKQFVFNSGAHILRIGTERARNLGELLEGVRNVPDSSIFQHMFQTLADHHYIREGFSNDFAHWAFFSCNETGLAERLAGIDVREYTSIADMRQRIVQILEEYSKRNPESTGRKALETFYFCSSDTVVIPTSITADNLDEFIDGLRRVSLHSIHYHFINARLRIKLPAPIPPVSPTSRRRIVTDATGPRIALSVLKPPTQSAEASVTDRPSGSHYGARAQQKEASP